MFSSFDEVIPRKGTDSYKYDMLKAVFGADDLLSMWVADMDFRTPACVLNAIQKTVDHGILGYTAMPASFPHSIGRWLLHRHQWQVNPDEIGFVAGVVHAIAQAITTFSRPGDKILIQTPVYHPFRLVPEALEREVVMNRLLCKDSRFEIDFETLEAPLQGCRIMILCHPHNPGGRVWLRPELEKIAGLCARAGVLVISDEIHADLTLHGHTHIPFATVSEEACNNCLTLMAPSKTFNMAGLDSSFFIAGNPTIRNRYKKSLKAAECAHGHMLAYTTAQAAFDHGEPWLEEALHYIEGNITLVTDYIATHLPQLTVMQPEASFLIWINFEKLGLSPDALHNFLVQKAKLALNRGDMFGPGGEGWARMNIGCPRSVVKEALERLKQAILEL